MTTATVSRELVYRRPPLYAKQRDAIFDPARYAVVEASTKAGKTYGCIVWLAEAAMRCKRNQNVWWVAPTFVQAKIAYRRLRDGLPAHFRTKNDSDLTLTLPNGAVIWFKTAEHPDALYGEDVYAAVIDEATRCREEAWHAVRSTLTATRGHVRIIGNVKGRKNWAYRLARKAESGEPDMAYHRITWRDAVEAGVLDVAEIEDARRQLPAAVFQELYEAEPSDDEGNPFGITALRECIAEMSTAPVTAFGVDLAKHVDWTVIVGLDAAGATCRFERFQAPWQDTIARIQRECIGVPTLVDSTGVGDPVLEALQAGQRRNFEGYGFTSPSKQKLMEGLAVAIQQHEITFPDGVIVSELESFEYQYTRTGVRYSAPEGQHDDCVMALALARERYADKPRRLRAL